MAKSVTLKANQIIKEAEKTLEQNEMNYRLGFYKEGSKAANEARYLEVKHFWQGVLSGLQWLKIEDKTGLRITARAS